MDLVVCEQPQVPPQGVQKPQVERVWKHGDLAQLNPVEERHPVWQKRVVQREKQPHPLEHAPQAGGVSLVAPDTVHLHRSQLLACVLGLVVPVIVPRLYSRQLQPQAVLLLEHHCVKQV